MTEFDTSNFVESVYNELVKDTNLIQVVLVNPTDESSFPCAVIGTPLKRVQITEDGTPIEISLSIQIDYWADKKYTCLSLSDTADRNLRNLNLVRINTTVDTYDTVTRKYRYGGNYETTFNALTNAFENRR